MKFEKLFICLLINAITPDLWSKNTICISLGGGCNTALALRELQIRTEAFPFDWIVSPFYALYEGLISDFKFFLTDLTMRTDNHGVIDHYGFNFTHDWPTIHNPNIDALNADVIPHCHLIKEWEEVLPLVKKKYQKRIERFRDKCLENNKIIFIRWAKFNRPKEESIKIKDFFKKNTPY